MSLGTEVGLGPGHIVLDEYPAPLPENVGTAAPSIFRQCLLCPNGWIDQDATWYGGRPRPKRHCVSSTSQKGGIALLRFSAHTYCRHTAAWIKMPRSRPMDVVLGRGHIVVDGDTTPPSAKNGAQPQFSANVCCGRTAGWIKMPLGTKVGLGSGRIVSHGDPAPLSQKGHSAPIFGPCLLWPNGGPFQLLLSNCLFIPPFREPTYRLDPLWAVDGFSHMLAQFAQTTRTRARVYQFEVP